MPQRGKATDLSESRLATRLRILHKRSACESRAYRRECTRDLDTLEAMVQKNHNAFSKSEIETQMQRQEEKVNMREAVDAGLVVTESSGTKPDKQDTSSSFRNNTHKQ
ncbi:hypothetical protein Tco_0822350 [Tanacetum coccineum]|uniref:Uncharacterized protein n=1 Tax=Tanacetum coccineum TaxID=301880 RepID=A0ABQ5AFW0_9ASTR